MSALPSFVFSSQDEMAQLFNQVGFYRLGLLFFLSSRRRHTRWTGDWSSDVCSSDLVLDNHRVGAPANRFGQARALGRVLIRPQQKQFILSAARGREERIAGAFAAELLAPAEGIRQMLDVIGSHSDNALDAIARRYKVSSLLVRYQYDNQIATASHTSIW